MIPEIKPGVYLLMARAAQPDETEEQARDYWDMYATQWIVVSDIGLSTMSGEDGLNVSVARSRPRRRSTASRCSCWLATTKC